MAASKQKVALTPAAAMTARRMHAERDSRGRAVHSYRSIGRFLGVSESTVMRAVNGDGAYMLLPEHKSDEVLNIDAKASLARMLTANPDLIPQGTDVDIVSKLNADIAKAKDKLHRGDRLLEELQSQPEEKKDGKGQDERGGSGDDGGPVPSAYGRSDDPT